ncbi:TetR/AcrR family transcriptional regulator [Vallicoccus soli]|uniref:TetR/AcrR family transcriptional regulator n=1 Tax=Vallicoccus soli TaxID=2339232 RepID=A0A3A3YYV1_9ACTN|nr:TetR/AcrR family transcriptional regulator [Vallicoccus soli]RJK94318.1 TetR/AcrR family transcriptional regulator [Vallicoccus soli]
MTPEAARPLRADARRNRERLLRVAVRALSQPGRDVPLEDIAREAGVGIGTLYRHFPTREALVEAAYRDEVERLAAAAGELLAEHPPDVALRHWMDRFVDYMTTKRGMADALRAVVAGGGDPYAVSRERLHAAVEQILGAAAAAGALRADVGPEDVLKAVSGVSLVTGDPASPGAPGSPAQREQAGRLLDLLLDGLRAGRTGD